uniref:VWFA domain-containing protein n=1 Tax=Panagrolaimus davidi TaxID=227884 RepID=A0A914PMI3_9BILA
MIIRIFLLFLALATTKVLSEDPYYPCQNWITVLSDNSKKLSYDQFSAQTMFLDLNVMEKINHPERIQYGTYNGVNGNMTYKWNATNTQDGLITAIDKTVQTEYPSGLDSAIKTLILNANINSTALIFVSDTTSSIDIQKAVHRYNADLKGKVKLTFILAGHSTNAKDLKSFNDAIIFNWQNIEIYETPDLWDLSAALRCTQLTPPPPTMNPYIPCKSFIFFGIDDSIVLAPSDFTAQLSFISSAIGNITYPERISASGIYSNSIPWNSGFTIPQMQNAVIGISQGGAYRLRMQFTALLTSLQNVQIGTTPVGALIFVSDTSNSALLGAGQFFNQLPKNIRITFILLGENPDKDKLEEYSTNFIYWRDFVLAQPDDWVTLSYAAYGC